jgi:translation elongation factor EF-Tu-like GTPase
MKFVSKIDDVFDISERGCIVVPGVPYTFEPTVVVGAAIEIRNPDGRTIQTQVKAFEMINRGRPMDSAPFLLPRDLKKQDIQVGADIFLLIANEQNT